MRKNETVTLTITDVNNKGFGVARLDGEGGKVVFVAGAVTGEVVRAKIIKVASDYLVARVEETLTPSALRCDPDCPVFSSCGGCVTRHISYDYERKLKEEYVKNAFRKAKVNITVEPVVYGDETGYRNKVECPLTADYEAGFYSPRSHKAVAATGCRLENPALTPVMKTVTAWLKDKKISLYDEESGKGLLRHVYLRIGETSGEIMVTLVINGKTLPHADDFAKTVMSAHPKVVSVVLNHNESKTNVILGKDCTVIAGKDHIEDSLCGLKFRLAPLSFYQVNGKMAEKLYREALALAKLEEGDTLADLFCGVGTIGLFMLKNSRAKKLLGVEIIPEAVANAKVNAKLNGLENAEFVCGDANLEALADADVVVVDPPRKGCGEALLKRLAEIAPKRIVYISCNPDTLARDVALLAPLGYTADTVKPFDLFPRTGHVESVVCLKRRLDNELRERMN